MRQIQPPLRRSDRSRRLWLAAVVGAAGAAGTRCARAETADHAAVAVNAVIQMSVPPGVLADAASQIGHHALPWAWALLVGMCVVGRASQALHHEADGAACGPVNMSPPQRWR